MAKGRQAGAGAARRLKVKGTAMKILIYTLALYGALSLMTLAADTTPAKTAPAPAPTAGMMHHGMMMNGATTTCPMMTPQTTTCPMQERTCPMTK
ncbi:MAG: hypothetical protein WDO13_12315 [Verrucomicrobiota bacterium]